MNEAYENEMIEMMLINHPELDPTNISVEELKFGSYDI